MGGEGSGQEIRVSKGDSEIVHATFDSYASEFYCTRVAYTTVISSMPKLVYSLNIENSHFPLPNRRLLLRILHIL